MNYNKAQNFGLSILLIFCFLNIQAQRFNIKSFSADDGLGQSQILDVMQTTNGEMWLATNGGGVSCFNGIKFFNITEKDGLSNNHANVVFQENNGTVWVGTNKGLNWYRNKKMTPLVNEVIRNKAIFSICEHSNGELWIGTDKGILIYNGKTFSEFEFNPIIGDFQVSKVLQDKFSNTWIATMGNGIFCYNGKKITHFNADDGLLDTKNKDLIIINGKLWVATYHGINVLDVSKPIIGRKRFDTLKLGGKPYLETVYKLYKDSRGTVWIGNNNGVCKVTKDKVRQLTRTNGLCNALIDGITEDTEGNIWFGSFGGGLSRFRSDMFVNVSTLQGLVNNNVSCVFKDKKDNMWVGTMGGGVSKMDYKTYKKTDSIGFLNFGEQKNGLSSNLINGICEDAKGDIWISTSNAGVDRFDGKKFTEYDVRNGLDGVHVNCILGDKAGNVWIGCEKGVDKFDGKKFKFYGEQHVFSMQGVNTIYEDDLGYVWFGCNDKILKYDGSMFTQILRSEGFPHIKNILKDKYGYMWFSTDAGVCVYNGKLFKPISENDGLCSNVVNFVESDANGDLWIGTNKGVDKLDLDKYINQKELVLTHYGKEEGFVGGECNPNSFYKCEDGKLWMGTPNGVMIYDPKADVKKNKKEPLLQITAIRLFLENVDLTKYCDSLIDGVPKNFSLPYNKNHVTFDFIGISQSDPEKVKYQYKLEGADIDWSPEAKRMEATYSNLPPGNYIFMLKAKNGDGVWSAKPYSFSFEIISPLWKRPWFYILLMIIGVTAIYFFVKVRERRLRYQKTLLERQVSIRTKELFEEKEKLQFAYSEIDEQNKAITDSIHYAKRIQNALLPTDAMMKQLFPDSFVFFRPKDIVSGDFYWMEQWGHQTLLAVADCTGHGVPGAFMSIVGHNILTQSVNVLGLSKPALILNETNKQLSRKLNQNTSETTVMDGMDIAMIAINYTKSTMEFAGANNPCWIIRNNELIEVKGNKFPIGAFVGNELQKFTNHEWELQKGDYIYIFSDGYADQFGGEKGKKFKFKSLQQLLLENHKKPLVEQRNILEKTFDDWRGTLEQVDDVLIIGLRI